MKKIIVVDDSSVLRTTLQNALNSAGFKVIGTAQGSAALFKMLEDGLIAELLLLDIFFPDESGVDILKKIKAEYPQIKVLVITAINRADLNKEIFLAGADDILHKPFDMDDLLRAIQKVSL
jgi:DNA-binding response OmpR family regulator